jgi:hypothetical protein
MMQQLTRLRHFFWVHPIVASLVLLAIALLLRITDIFILRLHEVWGEILLSKALGFLAIIGYLWFTRQRLRAIGWHARHLGRSVLIAVVVTAFALFAARSLISSGKFHDYQSITRSAISNSLHRDRAIFDDYLRLGVGNSGAFYPAS